MSTAGRRESPGFSRGEDVNHPQTPPSDTAGAPWEHSQSRLDSAVALVSRRACFGGGGFANHIATEAGISVRTVQMYLRIGERILPSVREALVSSGLDKDVRGLYALSGIEPDLQLDAVALVVSGEAAGLSAAVRLLRPDNGGGLEQSGQAQSGQARLIVAEQVHSVVPHKFYGRVAQSAVLGLWVDDLATGLRTAACWGFRVVGEVIWVSADPSARRAEFVESRHLTMLIATKGRVPAPAIVPCSVLAAGADPHADSARMLEAMWPAWAPAVSVFVRPRTAK